MISRHLFQYPFAFFWIFIIHHCFPRAFCSLSSLQILFDLSFLFYRSFKIVHCSVEKSFKATNHTLLVIIVFSFDDWTNPRFCLTTPSTTVMKLVPCIWIKWWTCCEAHECAMEERDIYRVSLYIFITLCFVRFPLLSDNLGTERIPYCLRSSPPMAFNPRRTNTSINWFVAFSSNRRCKYRYRISTGLKQVGLRVYRASQAEALSSELHSAFYCTFFSIEYGN